MRTFGSETCGRFFRFAKDVRDFVFAADVRETLDFAGTGGSEEDYATCGELGFDVPHASDDIAVEARAWAGREFELRLDANSEGELVEMNLGSFSKGGSKFFFRPEIVWR